MSLLYFVTPAWRRYDLTAVCLEQRKRVIDTLAEHDIEARCVIVADDDNLDLARKYGFDTVEQRNDLGLGRKFNDGYQYAAEQGATWIVPIGSDSWIDPGYFLPLPPSNPRVVRTSQLYVPVELHRLAITRVAHPKNPAGPNILHRDLLRRARYRPAPDELNKHLDKHTLNALRPFRWQYRDVHPFQYIGFRGLPHITSYDKLVSRWGVREHNEPWAILARYYPEDLVAKVRGVMERQSMEVAA